MRTTLRLTTTALLYLTLTLPASAYYVRVVNQVANFPDAYSDIQLNDGPTLLEHDTGLLIGAGSQGRSYGYGNLATGAMRGFVSRLGNHGSQVSINLYDILYFDLPDGVTEAPVTLSMDVNGTKIGATFGNSSLGLGSSNTGNIQETFDGRIFGYDYSVTTVVREGIGYQMQAYVNFQALSSSDYSEWNVLNTAYMSIALPEGVTFSSESNVFLTQPIPVPPALWLAVSGLGVMRFATRRRATPAC